MRTKKPVTTKPVVRELSAAEVEKLLQKVGKLVKAKREAIGTIDDFAYEAGISRSALTNYEAGKDMYLSTFFKLVHGLNEAPPEFLKDFK